MCHFQDKENMCINSIQQDAYLNDCYLQLDFAVTVSAMLGIPFPFGRNPTEGAAQRSSHVNGFVLEELIVVDLASPEIPKLSLESSLSETNDCNKSFQSSAFL
ncbi:hypothetical protein CK203_038267 [Vitis vinifera]|uniref:Uncharacterized protein n=1 Tax=Vitis vinifera TaxID=29760 RepID=A0A438IBN0_VITVI|nr:hypothetical protein CK203_038267 [Vitis vinifera]